MKEPFILQNKVLIDKLRAKIEEIINCFKHLKIDNGLPSSLFSGNTGIALFLFYYSQFNKNECYAEKAMNFLANAIENIKSLDYTFCNGISGICWCIQHLIKKGLIDIENYDILLTSSLGHPFL